MPVEKNFRLGGSRQLVFCSSFAYQKIQAKDTVLKHGGLRILTSSVVLGRVE